MPVPPTKVKKKRSNWGKGGNLVRLIKVVHDWDNKTGDDMDIRNKKLWLVHFCTIVGIPLSTFENYFGTNQRDIGKSVGRLSVLNPKDVTAIKDTLRWVDPANDTYLQRETIDMVQELHGGMIRKKASRQLTRNVINKSDGLIKRRDAKAQKTTTK